jgi:Ca-activated chloride channel homolog
MNPRRFIMVLAGAALAAAVAPRLTAESPGEAFDAYSKGDYRKARVEYERLATQRPDDPRLRFNAGAAAYKQNDFTNAAGWFESALATSDVKLQQKAYYNLGDTRYRLGETQKEADRKMALWRESLTNFSAAVNLDPADTNAASNLAYVRQRIEELERQQPPPQQQQKSDDKQQDKDKNKDQQQNQQSSGSKDKNDKQDRSKQDQQNQSGNQQDQQPQRNQGDQQDQQQENQSGGNQKQDQQQKAQQAQSQGDQQSGKEGSGKDGKESQIKRGEAQAKGEGSGDDQQAEALAEEAAKSGEMSPSQAARLLDSQKGNEKALVFSGQKSKDTSRDARKKKPW